MKLKLNNSYTVIGLLLFSFSVLHAMQPKDQIKVLLGTVINNTSHVIRVNHYSSIYGLSPINFSRVLEAQEKSVLNSEIKFSEIKFNRALEWPHCVASIYVLSKQAQRALGVNKLSEGQQLLLENYDGITKTISLTPDIDSVFINLTVTGPDTRIRDINVEIHSVKLINL